MPKALPGIALYVFYFSIRPVESLAKTRYLGETE